MQTNKVRSVLPVALNTSTSDATSSHSVAPVEIITGLPVDATFRINAWSLVYSDAILYRGASRDSKKSTAVESKGELKGITFNSRHRANNSGCQSQGVCAS